MEKPLVNEVFADNGEHSHWNLIDVKTGANLWSENPIEDKAVGHKVENLISHEQTFEILRLIESHQKLTDGTGLTHEENQEYEDLCSVLSEILPLRF